ncbi:MAG: hypothetical protein AAF236_00295 [Verrucomicrobiota bacterium]
MRKHNARNSWILFLSAIACVFLGGFIGAINFSSLAGQSNGGGSGLSGILLIVTILGGSLLGGLVGAFLNLAGVIQAILSLKRIGAGAGAIIALILNVLMVLGFGSICAMAFFAQYV